MTWRQGRIVFAALVLSGAVVAATIEICWQAWEGTL